MTKSSNSFWKVFMASTIRTSRKNQQKYFGLSIRTECLVRSCHSCTVLCFPPPCPTTSSGDVLGYLWRRSNKLDPYLLERTFFHVLSLPAKPTIFQCIDFVLFANQFAGDTNASSDLQLLAKCTIALAIYQSHCGPRARPPLAPHR